MAKQNASHIDDPSALGRRLHEARRERKLTQAALAFEGCTIGHISRIEAGLRTPSLQVVRRLAEKLGVDDYWLATGSPRLPETPAETLLREAAAAVALGEAAEAKEALSLIPAESELSEETHAQVAIARGRIALLESRYEDAISYAEKARELDQKAAGSAASEILGQAYGGLKRHAEGRRALGEALAAAEAGDDRADRVRVGVLLAAMEIEGDPSAARATLARIAGDLDTADTLALARERLRRSRTLRESGNIREAVELGRRALAWLEAHHHEASRAQARALLAQVGKS
jgi:transcriptional regulator with XRE-family HTH domain